MCVCFRANSTLVVQTGPTSIRLPSLTGDEPETTPFAGQVVLADDSLRSPGIHVIEVNPTSTVNQIGFQELLGAPAVLSVLISLSVLKLHGSAFDLLVLETGNSGHSLSHALTPLPKFLFGISLGILLLRNLPVASSPAGPARSLRRLSVLHLALYIITPTLMVLIFDTWESPAPISSCLLFTGNFVTAFSYIFLIFIVLNMSPSPSSTGTLVGLTHVSSLFEALGLASGVASFYSAEMLGGVSPTYFLWGVLIVFALLGVVATWSIKEGLSLDRDLDAECLGWEVAFEYDADAKMTAY